VESKTVTLSAHSLVKPDLTLRAPLPYKPSATEQTKTKLWQFRWLEGS
jgi:hypothetical protein